MVAILTALVPGCPQLKLVELVAIVGVPESPAAIGWLVCMTRAVWLLVTPKALELVPVNPISSKRSFCQTTTGVATRVKRFVTFVAAAEDEISTSVIPDASAVVELVAAFTETTKPR